MSGRRATRSRVAVWVTRHPWAASTVWWATLFVLAASVARAFVSPLLRYDEPAHLDYVLSVWHHHLPVFEDGLTYRAPFGWSTPVQWVSQHPPLYYLLLAPVVGPLFDSGHALVAVIAGRLMSSVMAAMIVVAAAWAAARCFPRALRLPGAAAVVTAFCGLLIQQGGLIYNDILYVLLLVVACGIAGAALRTGMGPGLLVAATVVGAAGMATRLSFVLWLVAIVTATLFARRVQLWGFGGVWARILAAAAAASGWFYLHNKETSGNFSGRHADWGIENMGRVVRPFWTVATDDGFWTSMFSLYRASLHGNHPNQWVLLLGPMLLAAVSGVVLLVRRRRRPGTVIASRARRGERGRVLLVVAMFIVLTVLLVIVEIDYVHGGGAPITRYALTVLPVFAITMAAGLTTSRRLSGLLVTAWTVLGFITYLSLVDLDPELDLVVPHTALVSRVMLAVTVVAAIGCVVGSFLDARWLRTDDDGRDDRAHDGRDDHRSRDLSTDDEPEHVDGHPGAVDPAALGSPAVLGAGGPDHGQASHGAR